MIARADFLKRRKTGIGGSDAAKIMGVSQYGTALDVYRDKTSDEINEEPNDVLELASYLEDFTARKYAALTGFDVRRKKAELVHPDYPFLKGNIDRQIFKSNHNSVGVLECKALGSYNFRRVESYGLPPDYIIQMQFYFLTGGYRWGAFAILNRDSGRMLTFEVTPDHELCGRIQAVCVDFWMNSVAPRVPPVERGPEKELTLPKYDGKLSDLNGDAELAGLCAEYSELKGMESQVKELLDECGNRIKDRLGDIQAAECRCYRIYYAESKPRESIDGARLKKEQPEIYQKYRKLSAVSRSFKFYQLNQRG